MLTVTTFCFSVPSISLAQTTDIPASSDFSIGEKWVWIVKDGLTGSEERRITRTVAMDEGILKFSRLNGRTYPISQHNFINRPANKPWRVWPLEVGRKWKYDGDWIKTSTGTLSNTKQDVEVVSFEEVTVPAGTFMAFKIEHKGGSDRPSTSRPGQYVYTPQIDTYWYAPSVKADVKHIGKSDYDNTIVELVSYEKPSP